MEAARLAGVSKFVSAGTVCAYPQSAKIPLEESSFWDGYPDVSNAPYCLAKKMGLVQAQTYRKEYNFNAVHLLLTNMYGPGDVFDPTRSRLLHPLSENLLMRYKMIFLKFRCGAQEMHHGSFCI